ncbi:hypothetical protein [Flavobacterium sp. 3HN19-14]|uniref:hypothetical protein n=1 Tax=Flavobacterium sp. 3HN19-14 TaxID=3448133 RepID=UPI003EE0E665
MLAVFFLIFVLFVNRKLHFIVNRVTLFLGKISFALYLIHQWISIDLIIPFFTEKMQLNFWVVVLVVNLPLVILLATAVTFFVEIPAGKKLKTLLHQKLSS